MILHTDGVFGDKKMNTCVECGKKLGIIGGYRHPTLGKEHHLCSSCFDTVLASVETYRKFITPYVGFFNKESSTREDIQQLEKHLIQGIKKMQAGGSTLRSHNTHHYTKC